MPRGRQSDVIYFPSHGHQVVLGTAGTGKTTMAMLRASHLADPNTANHGRVLMVTFNNTLVTYLKWLQPETSKNITIETYGLFARGYLDSRGQMPPGHGIVDGWKYESLVAARSKGSGRRPGEPLLPARHGFLRRRAGVGSYRYVFTSEPERPVG